MWKPTSLLAAAVALVGVSSMSSTASAQSSSVERQWELLLGGSGASENDFDGGGFNVNAQVGYYFTDQLQLNLRQGFGYSDYGDSSWQAATRVGFDYHFDYNQDQRFIPYIGVVGGYLYGDGVSDTFVAGPEAGLKAYVNETTFIYGSVAYEFLFDDAGDADSSFDDGQFVYGLGIGFRW